MLIYWLCLQCRLSVQ